MLTPAPFDAWLAGDDAALSAEAKQGLEIFMDQGCSLCHYGPNLGGDGYYPFGLVNAPGASAAEDAGHDFRTAPLRNVALTAPYFHDNGAKTLRDAVAHYQRFFNFTEAQDPVGSRTLGGFVELTDQDVDDIVAYLQLL